MRLIRITTAVAMLLLPAVTARGDDASPKNLQDAVQRLGDPDARVRDEAANTLRTAGAGAEPALRSAAATGDPETARRAAALLRRLGRPDLEEPPELEPPEVRLYRAADRESRAQIIERLGTGYRAAALVRLWNEEEDGALRAAMFNAMVRAPAPSATAMIADGNAPAAERLLDAALAQGNADAAAPYAALCLLRGQVAAAIRRWSAPPPPVANPAGRGAGVVEGARAVAPAVLARLHRAAGDCPAAVAAARRSGDPVLLQEMLLAAGHWGALAEAAADRPAPAQTPKQLGLLAAAHHLAGDARGFDDALARMRKLAKPETLNDVAETLFLGGRAGEGLRLLEGGGSATAVARLKVLAAQERWDEAWALVESQDTARDEAALSLRVAAAEQWHGLGEMRHAADLLARVARENAALDSPEVHALLGETYRKIGQPDAAWPHFRAAMKLADGRNADAGRMVWLAFRVDVDRDGEHEVNGANVWEFVGGRFRGEGVDAQFDRTRSIVEGMMPLEELKRLAGDRRHSQRAHAAGLPLLIGHRMNADGQEADAVQYLAEAAENAPAPEYALQLYLRLGDWAAARRDWPKAAGFYGRAWNADRSRSAPLYLRSWALREAGWPGRAGELAALAHALPLADPWRRHEAVKVLHEHRIDAALWGEVDVILRTVRPGMLPADFAQRLSAERAVREGNWLAAANGYERSALNYVAFYDLPDPAAYLRIADTVRRMRAKGMLAKGDVEAAEREIAGSRTALPGDVMMPIDVIPEFERLGNKARADELYADVMGRLDTILAKHPGSANHHNSAAWLAVNCGRDADKALAHARRAVELQPDRAAYLDTLAEVLFRRGEIDEAMRMITRCAELDPRSPRHREQLERFDAAKRGESRPMPPG